MRQRIPSVIASSLVTTSLAVGIATIRHPYVLS